MAAARDMVMLRDERPPSGSTPLLERVMQSGRRTQPVPTLGAIRRRREEHMRTLPPALLDVDRDATYRVEPAGTLQQLISPISTP